MEFKLLKSCLQQILFKTSHLREEYNSLQLNVVYMTIHLRQLSAHQSKISEGKHSDLYSLCFTYKYSSNQT